MNVSFRLPILIAFFESLLLLPFFFSFISKEVNWSSSDYLLMGIMLLFLSIGIEIVMRFAKDAKKRLLLMMAVIFTFLLLWAELAVGIFNSPWAGQ